MNVLVGTNDLKNGGTYYHIEEVIQHPEFNNTSSALFYISPNDIGLIKINGTITFDDNVQQVDLATGSILNGTNLLSSKPVNQFH